MGRGDETPCAPGFTSENDELESVFDVIIGADAAAVRLHRHERKRREVADMDGAAAAFAAALLQIPLRLGEIVLAARRPCKDGGLDI